MLGQRWKAAFRDVWNAAFAYLAGMDGLLLDRCRV